MYRRKAEHGRKSKKDISNRIEKDDKNQQTKIGVKISYATE